MFNSEDIFSAYPAYRNSEFTWLSTDTQKQYDKNFKDKNKKIHLKNNGWLDNTFKYRINSQGFRGADFTEQPGIVFLGCSYTVGIGVPEENTFAAIVAKELKLQCLNLGRSAGSNDTCFRIGSYWIPKLKPKAVVLISPEISRFEIISNNNTVELTPIKKIYKEWFFQELNQELSLQKNILALRYISESVGAKFCLGNHIETFVSDDDLLNHSMLHDYGRDLAHPGLGQHQIAAKNILKELN